MQNSKGMQQLIHEFHENKLSHAFLLETNNQEECLQNLLKFLSEINAGEDENENLKLAKLIENESLPSLFVIRPDANTIKKEQILALKQAFKTKPTFSKFNMYIVLSAEDLNPSSANTILKFLEEPEDDILGFFLTNNKENIIDTIRSRCQIILDYYAGFSYLTIPNVWQSIAVNYVKEYELVLGEAILYNKSVLSPLIHDKKELLFLFQCIFEIYYNLYCVKIGVGTLNSLYGDLTFVLKKDVDYFSRQMNYVAGLLDEMNYNLNMNFLLDRFVLESR